MASRMTERAPGGGGLPRVTIGAALLVLCLALGAVLFPGREHSADQGRFLVFTAPGMDSQRQELFEALAGYLEEELGRSLEMVLESRSGPFLAEARAGADFVLCPDGLALSLERDRFAPLVACRRKMPANLRPRGVLVYRRSAGQSGRPWQDAPRRTVFGDSLSLVTTGGVPWRQEARSCAFGPDPYDHGPVLHALRLGAFDYALVRQWDAAAFFAAGLLDEQEFVLENRTPPVPDIVLMAAREASMVERVRWAEDLALVDVEGQPATEAAHHLAARLAALDLTGFGLLLEPDFERVRRLFGEDWPPQDD